MSRKLTLEEFIQKAKEIHDLKRLNIGLSPYDYTKIEKYDNNHTKVPIICHELDINEKEHGEFWQTPGKHLFGKGCPQCGIISQIKKRTYTSNEIISKFKFVHDLKRLNIGLSPYDYSLFKYNKITQNVIIICHEKDFDNKEHGIFQQTSHNHINGQGCPKCNGGKIITVDEFILKAQKIHGKNTYIYNKDKIDYKNNHTKICIICPEHGDFWITPNNHLQSFQGCFLCKSFKGENIIKQWLKENNKRNIHQHSFKNCRDKKLLRFDFYLPDYNLCIEYDGIQHFKPVQFGGISIKRAIENFKDTKKKDMIKTDFCKVNGIKLLRISYLNIDKIQLILHTYFLYS